MKTVAILLSLVLVGLFSTPAFAENGDCWFIFCIFEKAFEPKQKRDMTVEELYVQEADKGKEKMKKKLNKEISSLKEYQKELKSIERQTGGSVSPLYNAVQQDIDLYEEILYTEKDMRENPQKYYTDRDLINLAIEYFKVKPDGSRCDDDRVWIEAESNCVPEGSAVKRHLQYYDLEWLRYR